MEPFEIKVSVEKCSGTTCQEFSRERSVDHRKTKLSSIRYDYSSIK